ncbi:MAG: MraY family glycosyltransferase [Clostridia bacterium]|jgi:UDP-GlcNAc:undecaprenyl-phosphate GlcNAc-1-phosphate transferase|nr:MraY family glycosyltransferase [Clostridia bacterium]
MWGDIAIAFLLGLVTAFVVTPFSMRIAKKYGAIDVPNDRRVNKKPMPRLGGIAVIAGFFVSTIYLLISMSIEGKLVLFEEDMLWLKLVGFFVGIIILGITCFIDDTKGIHSLTKLIVQIVAALIVVACGIRIENFEIPFLNGQAELNIVLSYIITVCWIVGVTNAINLIDGLDGLSSGISLISCISLLIIFTLNGSPLIAIVLITALGGAISGFLPYNFNPAKTFIGDTGSNFLGFSLAVISILGVAKTYTALVLIAPIIVLALPLFDTLFAIFRRIKNGKSLKAVFKADKGHLHHRLMQKGYTQKQAVFILYGITATFGMFAVVLLDSGVWKALSFAILVIAILAIGYKDIFGIRKNVHEFEKELKEEKIENHREDKS